MESAFSYAVRSIQLLPRGAFGVKKQLNRMNSAYAAVKAVSVRFFDGRKGESL